MKEILQKIVAKKTEEVKEVKKNSDIAKLKNSRLFRAVPVKLSKGSSANRSLLIAEFKRKSPSKGDINLHADIVQQTLAYQVGGASAISVLTDTVFFGGTIKDIHDIRHLINLPVLRKDFIIDEFQIYETKSIGANIILLIASILSKQQLQEYAELAKEIGLQVLIEVHEPDEIDAIPHDADIIGINNRNLNTFDVNASHSTNTLPFFPKHPIRIAESGVQSIELAASLINAGFDGLLVGEYLMRSSNPEKLCSQLIFNKE